MEVSPRVPDRAIIEAARDRLAALFTPVRIGKLTVPNRLVMAAMGRLGSTDGVLGPTYADYYRRRAEGGIGLIIGEAAAVDDPMAEGYQSASRLYGERQLAAWKEVVDAIHAGGGLFAPQLWHAGIARVGDAPNAALGARSPSGMNVVPDRGAVPAPEPFSRPMRDSDIAEVIAGFTRSALNAQAIGSDAIQIHGAHGYLFDQFLWGATNRRDDGYGFATVRARARFSAEVVAAIKAAGVTIPITFRFSQWKMQDYGARIFASPRELEEFLDIMTGAGVDCFDVSTRRFWLTEFDGSTRTLAAWTKHLSGLPVIAVGSVGVSSTFTGEDASGGGNDAMPANLDLALQALERGDFDLIALGRTLLTNPQWGILAREGRLDEIRAFDPADLETIA